MSLGQAIKKARMSAGKSQVALAESLGVSQQLVSHIETDRVAPTGPMLAQIARKVGSSKAKLADLATSIARDPSLAPVQKVGRPRGPAKRRRAKGTPKRTKVAA